VDDLMRENYISNNSYAGMIALMPGGSDYIDNMFLHNNFINNNNTFIIQCNGTAWDDSYEGNYWSGYNGTDADQNGIGDSPYHLAMGEDTFPLIAPCYAFHFQISGVTHTMWIVSNAVIKEFDYSLAANGSKISFKTHTANSSLSNRFFRITIPSEVTKHNFTLEVDGVQIQNSTLRFKVQNPQKSLAVFYFTFSDDEHDYTFFIALLIAAVITVALLVILVRKRYRTKHQK
jgi:hypothetical protein